jgi:hypothetical protein
MCYKRLLLFIFISLSISNITAENIFDRENLINNGGFELKKLHRWIFKGTAQITSERSFEGENSLKLSNNTSTPGYAYQLSFADPNYESPNEKLKEFAFLYGWNYRKGKGSVSLAAGIGYLYAIRRGEKICLWGIG